MELTMKMIAAVVPFALLTLGVLGCSQQASTAPAVQHPTPAANKDTNMFGESKEDAAGNAANARAAAYGTDPAPSASVGTSGAAAESTPPK
jgi:hypothetical protein